MSTVTAEFLARWRQETATLGSGDAKRIQRPITKVYMREGRIRRRYKPWTGPTINSLVIGGNNDEPWQGTYVAFSDWVEIPNIVAVDIDATVENKGANATIVVEDVYLQELSFMSDFYHAIERGWLAPWRGTETEFTLPAVDEQNEWYHKLDQRVQVKIWQGYGEDELVPTFLGFVDDLDMDSMPDRITITLRDTSAIMADQRFYGWSKEESHPDPVTFANTSFADAENNEGWILVEDAADIVRLILRWCGFKEWYVEDTGMTVDVPKQYNRAQFLMDLIDEICEQTGFIFFIGDPDGSDDSLGYPIFRATQAIFDEDAFADVPTIQDSDLIKRARAHFTTEPLAHIIRVRGQLATKDEGGVVVSRDDRRLLSAYKPPWVTETTPVGIRTAGILRRTFLDRWDLTTQAQLDKASRLVALYQALASATAVLEINANPGINLDQHVLLYDKGSGLNTRACIHSRTSTFTAGGDETGPTWTMSLTGSLLDTPYMDAVRADLAELE